MSKPGVMFYFDTGPCLARLSDAEAGQLFRAILAYGENGTVPTFEGMLGVAWDFIRPRIDRDSQQYSNKAQKSKYAVYCRECKNHGITPDDFDVWKSKSEQVLADDIG